MMKKVSSLAALLAGVLFCCTATPAPGVDRWEKDFQKAAKDIESIAGRVHNDRGFAAMKAMVNDSGARARYRLQALVYISRYVLKWKVRPPDPDRGRAEALRYCAQAEKVLPQVASPAVKMSSLLKLAGCYERAKKPDRALPCFNRAQGLVHLIGAADQRLASQVALAEGYSKHGHLDKVRVCCSGAMKLVWQIDRADEQLPWFIRLAQLYESARDAPSVLRTASAAHALYSDAKDLEGQVKCLLLMGRAHERCRDFEEAVASYLRAAELTNDWEGFSAAARCLVAAGKPAESVKVLRAAVAKCPASAPGYGSAKAGAKDVKAYFDAVSQSAGKLVKERKFADARLVLRAATCFVGRNASCLERVSEAQGEFVKALLLEGKKEEAVAEAKRYFDFCRVRDIGSAVDLAGQTLKAADGDINLRVKAFLDFQRFGPTGKDKKTGTKDDLRSPLAGVALETPREYELLDALAASLPVSDHRGRGYVHLLKGDPAAALAEFRSGYAVAGEVGLADAIYDVATALKAIDGHTLRANRYLLFQKHGPSGKDGKPGTKDDLADPLRDVRSEVASQRQKALQREITNCGQDYRGLRRRGYLLLSMGSAREGLKTMQETYALCGIDANSLKTAIMDVATAIKAVDGHVFRANQYVLYQKYGPAGKDKKTGTKDDLLNPLAVRQTERTGGQG